MQQTELVSAVQDREEDLFWFFFPFQIETKMKLAEERKRGWNNHADWWTERYRNKRFLCRLSLFLPLRSLFQNDVSNIASKCLP
jgi:hypothetical protein